MIGMLNLDEMAHGLAGMTMFPYFDTAHYVVSVMALREQSGEATSGSFRSSGSSLVNLGAITVFCSILFITGTAFARLF